VTASVVDLIHRAREAQERHDRRIDVQLPLALSETTDPQPAAGPPTTVVSLSAPGGQGTTGGGPHRLGGVEPSSRPARSLGEGAS